MDEDKIVKQIPGKPARIMHLLLDMGQEMLLCGGEVGRVEDTLGRMGKAYAAKSTNVFVITSNIILTMEFEDGQERTLTRRIKTAAATDFDKLERLNEISRRCCQNCMTADELEKAIVEAVRLKNGKKDIFLLYLGSIFAAASFSLYMRGSVADAVVSSFIAVLICYCQIHLSGLCINTIFFNFLCSLIAGLVICLCLKIFPFLHMDKIMIGDIMLLIPGIAFTNSVKDMFMGDTITGMMRFLEALLWAMALACGFISAMIIFGSFV